MPGLNSDPRAAHPQQHQAAGGLVTDPLAGGLQADTDVCSAVDPWPGHSPARGCLVEIQVTVHLPPAYCIQRCLEDPLLHQPGWHIPPSHFHIRSMSIEKVKIRPWLSAVELESVRLGPGICVGIFSPRDSHAQRTVLTKPFCFTPLVFLH